jgi:hypothetical protein
MLSVVPGHEPRNETASDVVTEDLLARERLTYLVAGLVPCLLVLAALAGILSGSHHGLAGIGLPGDTNGGRAPDEIAWVSLVLLCMLLAYAALPLLASMLCQPLHAKVKSAADNLETTYGLNLAHLWPRLVQVLPAESTAALRRSGRQLAQRLGSAAGYALTGALAVFVINLAEPTSYLLFGAVFVTSIPVSYQAARDIQRAAVSYTELVVSLVELHRFAVLAALHLPLPPDPDVERNETWRWTRVAAADEADATPFDHHDDRDVPPTVARALSEWQDMFAEPALVNYKGRVAAGIEDADGQPLSLSDGRFALLTSVEYRLVISVGSSTPHETLSQPIEVTDGVTSSEATFQVSLDSGDIRFAPTMAELPAPTDGTLREYRETFAAPPPGSHRVFVYVLQSNRLLQILEVPIQVDPAAQE